MLKEAIQIIRELQTGEMVDWKGEYFEVDSARLWDLPDDPRGSLRWALSKMRPLLDDDEAVARADGVPELGVGDRRLLGLADTGADEGRPDAVDEAGAVPLGAQPTRMSPTASSGERLSACAMIQPAPGMMT